MCQQNRLSQFLKVMFQFSSLSWRAALIGGAFAFIACGCERNGMAQQALANLTLVAWPDNPLAMPDSGAHRLTLLSPTMLELGLVTRKEPDPAPLSAWDFAEALPATSDFEVLADGRKITVKSVGFKRRPIYAPLKKRNLRVGNWLYLELTTALPDGARVEVHDRSGKHFPTGAKFEAALSATRVSPVLHVSDEGFDPAWPKIAFAGYYLGSLGELQIGADQPFFVLDGAGKRVFEGKLRRRADKGWKSAPYQQVVEADFSAFKTPGVYRLMVPGLGTSHPFRIASGAAALLTRTYALGLYNQRSGMPITLPFSRHIRAADHTAPAEVPTNDFAAVNRSLNGISEGADKEPHYTAPRLVDIKSALYPFVKSGKIDVAGGHHDAGDYSVYTINSAQLISLLCFAADVFPGAGDLDNLGIPESGDNKSDLLEEAKWEADYLLKMQDADGGFFFLKYPRDRSYEDDVLPEAGDPQVVFPKNTSATAAATAALAQMASSARFKAQFPDAAAKYRAAALNGWKFLEEAIAGHGRDGSYQKVSHYGHNFAHEDELLWAATEMFLLTGDKALHDKWLASFDPASESARRWTWWRLLEGYGGAIRAYAFAPQTGRAKETALDARLLRACRAEVLATAGDQSNRAQMSAYGTSFPLETKAQNSAGWYFSSTNAFDLAAGYALEPRPEFLTAILTNFDFEWGANPQNVDFITGIGTTRQRDIVHQYAQNDRRVLPPTGIPLGNIVGGFAYLDTYKRELGALTFPNDGDAKAPYAPMDRWADTFNTTTEFVVPNQAAALGASAFLMGQSSLKTQLWRTAPARISGAPPQMKIGQNATMSLSVPGLDVAQAQVIWEVRGLEPVQSQQLTYHALRSGPFWIEAEALWPDGRRVAAASDFLVLPLLGGQPAIKDANTLALVNFDNASIEDTLLPFKGQILGSPTVSAANIAWMEQPNGKALQLPSPSAALELPLGQLPDDFKLSGRLYLEKVIPGITGGGVLAICTSNSNEVLLGLAVNKYPKPWLPEIRVGGDVVVESAALEKSLVPEMWQRWEFTLRGDRATVTLDGKTIYDEVVKNPAGLRSRLRGSRLNLGRVTGWIDDVAVTAFPKAK